LLAYCTQGSQVNL